MLKKLFGQTAYSKNILTLASGTALSQAIPLAISPILTRLFTPEDFGLFAVYFGILMIGSVFATGKYELAIVLPTLNKQAKALLHLSILICTGVSLLLFIVLVLTKDLLLPIINAEDLGWQILWLPLGLFGIGLSQSYYYYFNREAHYRSMAMIRIFRSVGYSIFALAGGLLAIPGTLILADALGYLTSVLLTSRNSLKKDITFSDFSEIKTVAYTYRNFPKFLLVSGILEKGSGQAPVFMLSNLFASMSGAGFFSFAQRIVVTPADLVARAIGDVFRQQASKTFSDRGECLEIFKRTFLKLFLVGLPSFTIAFFFVEGVFAFVFGEEWRIAGEYAKLMMPLFFFQFVVSPLSSMFVIAQKQSYDLIMQILLLIAVTVTFFLGHAFNKSITQIISLFTTVYCFKYSIELILSYRFASGYKR